MLELKKDINLDAKEEYNKEPVYYCRKCLSLKIKALDSFIDFCDECGGTDIAITDIYTWQEMYKSKYNKDFL